MARPWLRRVGAVAGVLLLGAALLMVWRQRDAMPDLAGLLTAGAAPGLALLAAAVVANLLLTGLLFSVLIAPYGRVGRVEMQAVIASATLVNYLPLRPGLFGRVAYHRAVNGIAVTDTVRVLVQGIALSVGLAVYLAIVALLARWLALPLWPGAVLPAPVLVATLASSRWRRVALAGLLRYADLLVWALRYRIAFDLIGVPIDGQAALALACVSVLATLVPFVSNGLGLREWAVGLFAPYLGEATLQVGLAADLVNRAVELVVVAAAGTVAMAWLTWRTRGQAKEMKTVKGR
ncbi:MAG: hypothetical protein ACYTGC_06175 [Planctomycetota bacterium]